MIRRKRKTSRNRKPPGEPKPQKSLHRKPPKPASWNCKRGTCRYCGEPIIENGKPNNRKHWHRECGELWSIMNNPSDARAYVLRRDRFTCQACGYKNRFGEFEVDHIEPLFESNGRHSYWQPNNLMLLCEPCHKVKTKADMIRFRNLPKN